MASATAPKKSEATVTPPPTTKSKATVAPPLKPPPPIGPKEFKKPAPPTVVKSALQASLSVIQMRERVATEIANTLRVGFEDLKMAPLSIKRASIDKEQSEFAVTFYFAPGLLFPAIEIHRLLKRCFYNAFPTLGNMVVATLRSGEVHMPATILSSGVTEGPSITLWFRPLPPLEIGDEKKKTTKQTINRTEVVLVQKRVVDSELSVAPPSSKRARGDHAADVAPTTELDVTQQAAAVAAGTAAPTTEPDATQQKQLREWEAMVSAAAPRLLNEYNVGTLIRGATLCRLWPRVQLTQSWSANTFGYRISPVMPNNEFTVPLLPLFEQLAAFSNDPRIGCTATRGLNVYISHTGLNIEMETVPETHSWAL